MAASSSRVSLPVRPLDASSAALQGLVPGLSIAIWVFPAVLLNHLKFPLSVAGIVSSLSFTPPLPLNGVLGAVVCNGIGCRVWGHCGDFLSGGTIGDALGLASKMRRPRSIQCGCLGGRFAPGRHIGLHVVEGEALGMVSDNLGCIFGRTNFVDRTLEG